VFGDDQITGEARTGVCCVVQRRGIRDPDHTGSHPVRTRDVSESMVLLRADTAADGCVVAGLSVVLPQ
jgi:hypothetical protein